MTQLDYFSKGRLKNTIYEHNPPTTLKGLKVRIMEEIARISPAQLCHVFLNHVTQAQLCLEAQGGF